MFVGISELGERAPERLELARSPPGPRHDLANASHRLRVGAYHGNRARVVKDVLCGNRLRPDPRFRKAEIFDDGFIEVMTDHKHLLTGGISRFVHNTVMSDLSSRQDARRGC